VCGIGIPEDCIAGGHVGSVPVTGPQTAIRNGVPTPDDGNGIEVWEKGGPGWFFGVRGYDGWGGDTSNDMGDERGEAEGEELKPILKLDVLGLVGEEDDGGGRVGSPGEEEEGEEGAGRVEHS
jgi:hypothetical protein